MGVAVSFVFPGAPKAVLASDLDFAKSELSRIGRSAMTNDQRKALSLADRYRQFKSREKRAAPPAGGTQATQPAQAAPGVVDGNQLPSRTSSGTFSSGSEDELGDKKGSGTGPVSFSLSSADCTEMLLPISDKTMKKEAIARMQDHLTKIGLYHFEIDGLVGSRTRIALRNFCESARFAFADDLQLMLRKHLVIASAHANWADTLASEDFARWARTQPDAMEIDQIRHVGDAKDVIALIERFENRGMRKAVASVPDYELSFNLNKEDLQQLKSKKDIEKRIRGLEGSKYASERDFEAALDKAFTGLGNPTRFRDLVREYADVETSLSLTEQSYRRLKVKNVAPHILVAMETLRGLSYPDTEIAAAVEQIVVGLQNGLKSFKPEELVEMADFSQGGGRFTRESMKKFGAAHDAADPTTQAVALRMRGMMEFVYQDKTSMTAAIRNVLRQLREEVNQVAPIVVAEADEVTEYSLDEESIQEIASRIDAFVVPEVFVDLIADIEGQDYLTADLFWMSTRMRFSIDDQGNSIRDALVRVIRRERATRIDDTLVGVLRDEKLPASVIAQLLPLKAQSFNSAQALEVAIDDIFVRLAADYEQYRSMVVAQARKTHLYDKSKVIEWSGGGCNCINPQLSGEVYGLYPFWLAGKQQVINFDLTTRIGFHGLSFDDSGNIPHLARWFDIDTKFIRDARSFGVGVDLVLTKRDWRGWTQMGAQEKAASIDALVGNIEAAVTHRLGDIFSRLQPFLSLGLSPTPTMANGVTLYLDGYPDDNTSVETFDLLIRQLSERLQQHRQKFHINLMFSSSQLGRGIFQPTRLSRTFETITSYSHLKVRFLVLLQEPVEDDRAQVRARIEHSLEGGQRLDLLRRVLMIVSTDGRNQRRLNDNTTFAEDNYGGLGFWPLPTFDAATAAENPFAKAIKYGYLRSTTGPGLRNTALCAVVCPNRWGFRIAWGALLLLLIGSSALYVYSCNHRIILERHFVWITLGVALPFFLITMLLLSCDPGWAAISQGNDLLVLVVLGVIGYALWSYRERKGLIELP